VISGAEDRAVNSASASAVAEGYGNRAKFHLAPGHAHYLFMEPGWETVAGVCADWAEEAPRQL
jgi:hypothetical protein